MTVIQTPRLKLELASFDDAEFIFTLLNDPTFIDNIVDKGIRTLEDAKGYIQKSLLDSYANNGFGLYITRLDQDNTPIGLCGLVKRPELDCPDVGYALLPQYVGCGYASEGAKAILEYGYNQLGLNKIVGFTTKDNPGSIKVLENIGLKPTDTLMVYGDECLLFE